MAGTGGNQRPSNRRFGTGGRNPPLRKPNIGPTTPDWVPTNTGKPSADELNRLSGPRITVPAANSNIPIIYGRDRQFGRPFFAFVTPNGQFLYAAYLFSIGAIDAFEDLIVDGVNVSDTSKGLIGKYAARGAEVSVNLGAATQDPDPLLVEAVEAMPSGNYTDTLDGVAYVVIKVPKGATSGFPRLEAIVRGLRVYDPRKDSTNGGDGLHRIATPSTWEYSDNPTLCFADFITQRAGWGVNWPSVADNAIANDEPLADLTKRRTLGLTLSSPNTVSAWVQAFRVYMGAYTPWEDGVIRVVPDRADVDTSHVDYATDFAAGNWANHNVAFHFTTDDIVENSLQLNHRSARNFPNAITVQYTDSSFVTRWISDKVTVEKSSVTAGVEKRRPSTINLPGIHNRSQAKREATERLNWFTNDLEGTVSVFDEGLKIQIGSIIAITHPIGLTGALFRVIDAKALDGRWTLNIAEYSMDAYSDEVIADPDYNETEYPAVIVPPAVQDLTADEELFTYPNALVGSRVRATWTALPDGYVSHYVVEGWVSGNKVFQTTTQDNVCVTSPVEGLVADVPVIYTIKVRAVYKEYVGDEAEVSTTIAGKTAPPLDVPSLTVTKVSAASAHLSWVEPAENDVATYEVRRILGTTPTWASGVLVTRTKSQTYTARFLPVGTHTFMVKAIDSYGNESTTAADGEVIVANPSPPTTLTHSVVRGQLRVRWDANPPSEFVSKYRLTHGTSPVVELGSVPIPRFDLPDMPAGTHTVSVYAIDDFNRSSTASTVEVTITENADELDLELDLAVAQEVIDRTTAVAAEALARANADIAVAEDAADALLNAQIALEASIATETTLRQNGDDSLASQIATISAGTGEQFDAKKIYYFDTTVESWAGAPTVSAVDGFLTHSGVESAPYMESPVGLAVAADTYRYVKARIRRVGTPTWEGRLRWRLTGQSTSWSDGTVVLQTVTITEPTFDANEIATIDFKDLDWTGTLDQIRVEFASATTATDYFEIDWIAVGRPSPGASAAALQDEATARVNGDAAEALARTTLASQMRGAVTGSDGAALASLSTGLLYQERIARTTADSAMAADIVVLDSRLDVAEDDISGTATAVDSLTTRVENAEDDITASANSITVLQSNLSAAIEGLKVTAEPSVLGNWVVVGGGTAEASYILSADSGTMGGYLLKVGDNSGNDMMWARYNRTIPYDPNKLYRVRVRARMEVGSEGPTFYAGIAGLNAAQTQYVGTNNVAGSTLSNSHYAVANSASETMQEYVAYFKGVSAGARTGTGTVTNPYTVANGVRHITPMFLANYNGLPGVTYFDYFIIEDADAIGEASANATAISVLDTRVTATETSITASASDITSLQVGLGAVQNPMPNMLANPTGAVNLDYWSGPSLMREDAPDGPRFRVPAAAGTAQVIYPHTYVSATAGRSYTASVDMYKQSGTEGSYYFQLVYQDSGGTTLSSTNGPLQSTLSTWERKTLTVVAPASCARIIFRMVKAAGALTNVYFRRAKFEANDKESPYSEEVDGYTTASALVDLDVRVTSAEGVNTSQASSLTALTASVSDQNASITTLSQVVASASVGNAIVNPGFEDATEHWVLNANADIITHASARSGGKVLIITGAATPGLAQTPDYVPVKTGQTLRLGFYARRWTTVVGPVGSFLRMNVRWWDENKVQISYVATNCSTTTTSTTFQEVFSTITVPAGAAYVSAAITTNATSGNWGVDDVVLEPLTDLEASALATVGVVLDVNGYVTGYKLVNDGSTGNMAIHADNFSIVKPGSSARTEYSNNNWRVYDSSNVLRVRMGVW